MNKIFADIDSVSIVCIISMCKLNHSSIHIYLKKYYLNFSYKLIITNQWICFINVTLNICMHSKVHFTENPQVKIYTPT